MKRKLLLLIVVLVIVSSIYYLEGKKVRLPAIEEAADIRLPETVDQMTLERKGEIYEQAKEIVAPSGFLNTDGPITINELIGKKVILIDFWTYSCINCQRTFPYLKAWYEKYKDEGFEIVSIHSPEFEFEKDRANVAKAIERFGLTYPVVQDNDFATWRAYKNRYWPRKYLIDIDGFIVYDHIGEGGYASTEMKIQELLQERMEKLGGDISTVPTGIAEPQNGAPRRLFAPISPEVYFGALRNKALANGLPGKLGAQTFKEPGSRSDEKLYLAGEWNVQGEFAENESSEAKIIYRYQAKDVFMVLSADKPIKVTVLRNGKLLTDDAGADVDAEGFMIVHEERLYKIVANSSAVGFQELEFTVETPGLKAFTFTFG